MDKRKDIAREIARRYGVLSTPGLDLLAEMLTPIKAPKGFVLLSEGDVCAQMFYIQRGMVELTYVKHGKTVTERFGQDGETIFNPESLLLQTPSRITIKTIEPSVIYALHYPTLTAQAQYASELNKIMLGVFSETMIRQQQQADMLRFESASERYQRTLTEHPDIILRVPLHSLASYLQISPETLSRVRTALRDNSEE